MLLKPITIVVNLESDQNPDYNEYYFTHGISESSQHEQDLGEAVRQYILQHKKLLAGFIAFLIVIGIGILLLVTLSKETSPPLATQNTLAQNPSRIHPVSLPDNFTILLSEHRAVIINWQADETQDQEIWQLTSAQGDTSCQSINFNNGDEIRTTSVVVEDGSNYFANFSPLDTKKIIKNIAFRGKFTLCDYTFSLKGSQAALGKHPVYAEIVEY